MIRSSRVWMLLPLLATGFMLLIPQGLEGETAWPIVGMLMIAGVGLLMLSVMAGLVHRQASRTATQPVRHSNQSTR